MDRDKILEFLHLDYLDKFTQYLEFEKEFEAYVNEHPEDEEMWFKFILFEFQDEVGDYPKCKAYLRKMISYNNENILAKIFLAFIENWYWSSLTEETLEMLREICRSHCNPEFKSMAYYIKAWYYNYDEVMFEKYLLKSIDIYQNHVSNYAKLAEFYITRKNREGLKLKRAKELLHKAIENVKIIKDMNWYFSEDNKINYLFLDILTGVHQSEEEFNRLEETLKSLEENNL